MMAGMLDELFSGTGIDVPSAYGRMRIRKIQYDSRAVKPGDLFVAIKGYSTDGHRYLKNAEEAGAVLAVVERTDKDLGIPQISVQDSRKLLAALAYNRYRQDIDQVDLIGITGTNGKTTTSFLVRSVLNASGRNAGLIGTIAYYYRDKVIPASHTTPEATDIAGMVHEMAESGHHCCVLEVSSHALVLNRVDHFPFTIGLFTNLSHDHLDFHKNVEKYFKAKSRLFTLIKKNGSAVINIDDPYGAELADTFRGRLKTFGFSEEADVRALEWCMSSRGTRLTIQTRSHTFEVTSNLISLFNIQNILAAVAVGLAYNLDTETIRRGISELKHIPGRLEKHEIGTDAYAVIDYAHTPDALKKAAEALRNITKKRLIIVFGCGGDRDRAKRPVMGKIAELAGDHVIVTSDNPRSEDPDTIIKEIVAGMRKTEKYEIIPDRKEAIIQAVRMAGQGDIVLVAGKGHETHQLIQGKRYEFNEADIIKGASYNA